MTSRSDATPIRVHPGWVVLGAALVLAAAFVRIEAVGAQDEDAPQGTVWHRVPSNTAEFGGVGDQVAEAATAGGPGFVAVGNDSAGPLVQPAVWVSTDGADWERVDVGPALADPDEARRLEAVAADGDVVVAGGTEGIGCDANFDLTIWGSCDRSRPAVWWSVDAMTWQRVPADPQVFHDSGDSALLDLVAAPDGFYALVDRRARDVWDVDILFSPDGRAWSLAHRIDTRWPLAGGNLTSTPLGVLIFTEEFTGRSVRPLAAVRRGGGWVIETRLDEQPADSQLASIGTAAGGFSDTVIGVSDDFPDSERRGPLTWTSDSTLFVLGPVVDGARVVHRSGDGAAWEAFDADFLPAQTIFYSSAVFPGGPGLVAVQFAPIDDALIAASWVSGDGAGWQPSGITAPPLATVSAPPGTSTVISGVRAIAAGPDGAVAVGADGTGGDADAAFWFSAAGASVATGPATTVPGSAAEYQAPDGCLLAANASCPAANLDGADLAGLTAPGADLSLANLAGADLTGADLTGANLDGADLRGAILTGADLSGVSLEAASLVRANLDGAVLAGVELGHTDFTGASLRGVTAGSVDFGGTEPSVGAILAGADLRDADLATAALAGVDLSGADLSGADLNGANASGARLDAARLVTTIIREANLNNASLNGADLTGASAREASLLYADLRDARLTDADLVNAQLFGANLTEADLTGAQLAVTNFLDAILLGAKLPADLGNSDWGGTVCPDGFRTGPFPSGSCAGHEVSP